MKLIAHSSFCLFLILAACTGPAARAESAAPLDAARAAIKQGDLATAESLLAPLTAGEKPDAAAVHELGLLRQRQKRNVDAIALLERATTLDPSRADYFSDLGIAISQRMGEVDFMAQGMLAGKLRKAFAHSVELDPNHLPGLIGLARYYTAAPEIAGGSVAKATEFAQRVQKLDPFLGELELANIDQHAENFAGALAHDEAALALRPDNAWLHVSAGRALVQLNRRDDARAHYEAALKLNPNYAPAKKALAELAAPPS
ncbi:MAG TPA: tetratricopeptide repeat protein [Opitutaceae bacterium]|nr:tetratricopeptide repeat protein [Opitutaceae bacterium]